MARCINCNNELKPGNEFCGKCGAANKQIIKSAPGFSCPGCGGNVPFGSINCTVCGRPVPQTVSSTQTHSISCPSCGTSNYPDTYFCMSCGRPMPTVSEIHKQQVYKVRSSSKSIKALALSGVAIVLIIALIVGLWKPGYIWQWIDNDKIVATEKNNVKNNKGSTVSKPSPDSSQAVSVLSEEWMAEYLSTDPGTNPAPIPVSGTKAFKVTPAKGLTVSASENALDKEREFTAEKISDDKIMEITGQYTDANWLLLGGYEVSAGISPDERMPGLINVEMDLAELGVDKELWEFAHAVRIGDDGSVSTLHSKVNGSVLSCQTNQNSIIGAVLIGLTAGVGVQRLIELGHVGLSSLYKGVKFHHIVFSGENSSYDVYWPETLMSDTEKQYNDKIASLMKKHGLDPDGSLNSAALKATKNFKSGYEMMGYLNGIKKALYSDPEYIELARKLKNVDWSQKNYWPAEVIQTTNALALADKYLFGVRGFDTPGYNVDVMVLDKWPQDHGKETLGISMNLYTYRPFIHINAERKSRMPHSAEETGTVACSDLLLTITHELFHVVQSRAVLFDSDSFVMFWEAMAVSLEKEAFDYFSGSAGGGVINPSHTTVLTDRYHFNYLYFKSLLAPSLWSDNGSNKEYLRNHGYVASHWLDFLRDRYYAGNPNDFIPKLLKRFAASSRVSGEIFNLILRQHTANSSEASLGQPYSIDFIAFCQKYYNNMYGRIDFVSPAIKDIKLDADNPMAEINIKWQPLSFNFQDFAIDSIGADGKPVDYRLLIKNRLPWDNYYITRNFSDGTTNTTVNVDKDYFMLPISNSKRFTLMEIQAQIEDISVDEKSAVYQIYLLRQPEEPGIEIDEDYLVITPPDWSIPDPRGVLSGYDIIITGPGGAEYRHREEVSLAPVEIPLKDIKPKDKSKVSEEDEDEYTAYIVERIDMPDGKSEYGPDGRIARLGDELRFEDIIGQWDTIQNISNFKTPYLDALVAQLESAEGIENMEGMQEYIKEYKKAYEGVEGTHKGTMTITKTGENTAEVVLEPIDLERGAAVYYKGTWDDGILHLTPAGAIFGQDFDLFCKKKKGVVTCEGGSSISNEEISYSHTLTATKKN